MIFECCLNDLKKISKIDKVDGKNENDSKENQLNDDNHNHLDNNNDDDNEHDDNDKLLSHSSKRRIHKRVKRRSRRRAVRSLAELYKTESSVDSPPKRTLHVPSHSLDQHHDKKSNCQLLVEWVRFENNDVNTSLVLKDARFVLAPGRVTFKFLFF